VKDLLPYPVKRVVHLGSRSYGRITAPGRVLPSFLLCGGQRCGTTSLYRALSAHPAVLKAVLHRGVHYFDTAYHRGLGWYRAHFPLVRTARRVERALGVPAQAFESSPHYMYHPHAVGRIARELPDVRLVVLVRDPVERAHSQHAYELARGYEPEASFARALALEPARLREQEERLLAEPFGYSFAHQHYAYRSRGEYARFLDVMAADIGRDRILVVDSGEFFAEPGPVYDRVLDFLRLPKLDHPQFAQYNARPRTTLMEPELRHELTGHYKAWDQRLAGWLGATPSWRRG